MSRFPRLRRRPDHWRSAHERARARAAERLDGPLGLTESAWLDEHLAGCAACAAVAASYEADQAALRSLRDIAPVPPRDLWARTAAAIEAEGGATSRRADPAGRRRVPVGALSGIAVVAVVVGVSAVSSGILTGIPATGPEAMTDTGSDNAAVESAPANQGTEGGAPASAGVLTADPTPLAVGAGDVTWVGTGTDGTLAYNTAQVREVCPIDAESGCATLDDGTASRLSLQVSPKSIIGSPTQAQAVVVSDVPGGGQALTVVALPTAPAPAETPAPTEDAQPSAAPETFAPGGSSRPGASETPASEAPSATPDATGEAASPPPASAAPTATTTPSPVPTVAAELAIASDITVVGQSAAFSADGTWFAFTARPLDGSRGPDVYIWQVGDTVARPLTTDGATSFASWAGDTVVASRAGDPADPTATPTSVTIDPATGTEAPAGPVWQPVVAPDGDRAVAWSGTVTTDPASQRRAPAEGRLVLIDWPLDPEAVAVDGQAVTELSGADVDVRWDDSGGWFAVWVGGPDGGEVGRLTLFRIDPETGRLTNPDGAPVDVPALPGFSIGDGRLAWATPPGQDGELSSVRVVAWRGAGVGAVRTAPGERVVVIR